MKNYCFPIETSSNHLSLADADHGMHCYAARFLLNKLRMVLLNGPAIYWIPHLRTQTAIPTSEAEEITVYENANTVQVINFSQTMPRLEDSDLIQVGVNVPVFPCPSSKKESSESGRAKGRFSPAAPACPTFVYKFEQRDHFVFRL